MEKIKEFLAFLKASKFKLHRLANANLDMCYSKFVMEDLLSILTEKHEMAKDAGILSTDFYDGVCHVGNIEVQLQYMQVKRLTTRHVVILKFKRSYLSMAFIQHH